MRGAAGEQHEQERFEPTSSWPAGRPAALVLVLVVVALVRWMRRIHMSKTFIGVANPDRQGHLARSGESARGLRPVQVEPPEDQHLARLEINARPLPHSGYRTVPVMRPEISKRSTQSQRASST